MANKPKEKMELLVTPIGIAVYPYLTKPDTQFDADGEFKVGLVLSAKEAKAVMATIDKAMAGTLEKAKNENPTKAKKIKAANPPYTEVTDEEGQETGEIKFNFKMKAKITTKDGTVINQRPGIFDAAGNAIMNASIGGGTKMKVSAELVPYFTDLVGAGITLRLKAVQVIELVEYTGKTADKFGFKAEDGYRVNDATTENVGDDEADF
jgi:hypothetical protein